MAVECEVAHSKCNPVARVGTRSVRPSHVTTDQMAYRAIRNFGLLNGRRYSRLCRLLLRLWLHSHSHLSMTTLTAAGDRPHLTCRHSSSSGIFHTRLTQNLTSSVVSPIGTTSLETTGPTPALLLREVLAAEAREQGEGEMASLRSAAVLRARLPTSMRRMSLVSQW